MDFEEVLACLENTEKCEQFIRKLRKEGPNSTPFLNVQNAMVELKMHKPPQTQRCLIGKRRKLNL
jgi:hypothetical protein